MYMIGIDLGGTKIEAVLFDQSFRELDRVRVETRQQEGYRAILQRISGVCEQLTSGRTLGQYSIGIGTPGSIARDSGVVRYSNIQCVNGERLDRDISTLLNRPVVIENDANCFTLAEARRGAGEAHTSVFGMVMGTGCGGGLVINNQLIQGANGIAGEWGHSVFDPAGPTCYCGRQGCVERYLSGNALEGQYQEIKGHHLSLVDIVTASGSGDEIARGVMSRFVDVFARATANLISILDPDVIVLGGGLSKISTVYEQAIPRVASCIMNASVRTKIVSNVLGAEAGVMGAAMLGADSKCC